MVYGGDLPSRLVDVCPACGGEIYEDSPVWVIDGDLIHAHTSCLVEYCAPDYYRTAKEAITYLKVWNEERV